MTYVINNGNMYDNDFQWKVCDHMKKFVFLSGTTVKSIELGSIPLKSCSLKNFLKSSKEIVKLTDLKGNIIICSLWDNCGSKFLSYYNDDTKSGQLSLFCSCNDQELPSFQWKDDSKLLINEDIPIIHEILSKLPDSQKNEKSTQSTQTLSNWSGGIQFTSNKRFVYNVKCIFLSDFCKLKQETICVTVASTLKFAFSKYGWFYYGCTKFSLKYHAPTHSYKCGCGEDVKQPIPRYKVQIYVRDGDAKYHFVFWDNDCANIIGKIAEDMRKSMLEDGEDDPMVYPDELNSLLNQKMTFIVKHSITACGENEPDFNCDMTPIEVNSLVSRDVDHDCDIVGATQYSGTKPPTKKVKIEPNN
ncbi:hypothetical protein KIW84_033604 [Lathyrus oleraceus]|uniref:Replication factor A C-terminal domain-containing protein n=1 Tax=Pisum sativum TaxID=3888 RepID=A0A9D4Y0K1_PEA|nr:hypothetical protein KIW84_033604 [Pisum sativum]